MKVNLYLKGIMVVIAMVLSAALNAQSSHKISDIPYSLLVTGKYDNTIVNKTGNTGSKVLNLIAEWAKINGHALSDDNKQCFTLNYPHTNTSADKTGIHPFYDDSPSGTACGWEAPLWKEECCNLVATNANKAKLVELLQKFNAGNFISTSWGDNDQDKNQNLNKKENMDTVKVILSGATTVNAGATDSSSMPWWAIVLIIFGSIALIALIAWIIRRLTPRPADDFIANLDEVHRVEDRVIRRNRRQVQDAELDRYDRNQTAYDEENRQSTRYRAAHQ